MLLFFLPPPLPRVSCLSSASSHSSSIFAVPHPCKTIATSTFYTTYLSCLWPSCLHSSISSCCFSSFCLIPVGSCKQLVCTSSPAYQEIFTSVPAWPGYVSDNWYPLHPLSFRWSSYQLSDWLGGKFTKIRMTLQFDPFSAWKSRQGNCQEWHRLRQHLPTPSE